MNDMTSQDEQIIRQRDLNRMKWVAAGLLGLAACLYVVGKVMAWGAGLLHFELESAYF